MILMIQTKTIIIIYYVPVTCLQHIVNRVQTNSDERRSAEGNKILERNQANGTK